MRAGKPTRDLDQETDHLGRGDRARPVNIDENLRSLDTLFAAGRALAGAVQLWLPSQGVPAEPVRPFFPSSGGYAASDPASAVRASVRRVIRRLDFAVPLEYTGAATNKKPAGAGPGAGSESFRANGTSREGLMKAYLVPFLLLLTGPALAQQSVPADRLRFGGGFPEAAARA